MYTCKIKLFLRQDPIKIRIDMKCLMNEIVIDATPQRIIASIENN